MRGLLKGRPCKWGGMLIEKREGSILEIKDDSSEN